MIPPPLHLPSREARDIRRRKDRGQEVFVGGGQLTPSPYGLARGARAGSQDHGLCPAILSTDVSCPTMNKSPKSLNLQRTLIGMSWLARSASGSAPSTGALPM